VAAKLHEGGEDSMSPRLQFLQAQRSILGLKNYTQ
jgi:hypothetical protein